MLDKQRLPFLNCTDISVQSYLCHHNAIIFYNKGHISYYGVPSNWGKDVHFTFDIFITAFTALKELNLYTRGKDNECA